MADATSNPVDALSGESWLVGQSVGNFVLSQVLGKGGWGEVYLGVHQEIGNRVAIKVLQSHLSADASLAKRFLGEAKVLARIQHQNIVAIHDFGRLEGGRLFYVMEELKGCDLERVIAQRPVFSPSEALPYVSQICLGLQKAHDHGVVHRDLKPSNVFVVDREPLLIKLLDFGLAKLLGGNPGDSLTTQSGVVFGTPHFMAPEQAAGEQRRVSPQTDLYSLGVMLFRMLSGQLPFSDAAVGRVLAMHITKPPPSLATVAPGLPSEIVRLVDQCLEKEPAARPSSAHAFAEAFARACGEENPRAPGQSGDRTEPPLGDAARQRAVTPYDAEVALAPTVATPTPSALTRAMLESLTEGQPKRRRIVIAVIVVGALAAGLAAAVWSLGGPATGPARGTDGPALRVEAEVAPAAASPRPSSEPDAARSRASVDGGSTPRIDRGKAPRVVPRAAMPQGARDQKPKAAIAIPPPTATPAEEKRQHGESATPAVAPKAEESAPPTPPNVASPGVAPPAEKPSSAPANKPASAKRPRPSRIGEGTIPFE